MKRIRKVSGVIPTKATLIDEYSNSDKDGFTAKYINNHSVVVSSTEPVTDRKKVWLQHSKNLLNCNNFTSYSETNVEITTSYTNGLLNYINATKSGSTSSNVFVTLTTFTFFHNTGTYILNGCPSNGGTNTYQLYFRDLTTSTDISPRDEGNGASVSLIKGHQYNLYIRLNSSATFSNLKFYPMLRLDTDIDDTYEPYVEDKTFILNGDDVYEEYVPKQNEIYNTTEQKIGTWMGKPLYRKTLTFSVNHTASDNQTKSYTLAHNLTNIDKIFIDRGKSYSSGGQLALDNIYFNANYNTLLSAIAIFTRASVNSTNITYNIYRNRDYTDELIITVLYTKTTD